MSNQISRRSFLKTGCLATAGVVVALGGGTALAASYQLKIDLPVATFGNASAKKKILIAYATKAGSTAETSTRMGETLSKQGYLVEVKPVNTITDISSYQAVVLGSAIRMGSILPEISDYIQANQDSLKKVPFSVFIHCLTLATDNEENRTKVNAYLDPIRAIIQPAREGLFAGAMIPEKLKIFDRLIAVTIMKSPVGDFRNWDQINAWTENLPLG